MHYDDEMEQTFYLHLEHTVWVLVMYQNEGAFHETQLYKYMTERPSLPWSAVIRANIMPQNAQQASNGSIEGVVDHNLASLS